MKNKIYEIEIQLCKKNQSECKNYKYIGDKKQIMDFVKTFKYKALRKSTSEIIDKNYMFVSCQGNELYSHATVCVKGIYHRVLDKNYVGYNKKGENIKLKRINTKNEIKNIEINIKSNKTIEKSTTIIEINFTIDSNNICIVLTDKVTPTIFFTDNKDAFACNINSNYFSKISNNIINISIDNKYEENMKKIVSQIYEKLTRER